VGELLGVNILLLKMIMTVSLSIFERYPTLLVQISLFPILVISAITS
jgi:hypothetical protein